MTYLLDTHVVLWLLAGDTKLVGPRVRNAIVSGKARTVVSAVSIWEIAIKRALGKLEAPHDLLAQLERAGVELLPITARHANEVAELPAHHGDPFDRLLVAQARLEGLTLASADRSLGRYGVEVVW